MATGKKSLQAQLKSAQQDADSWRLAYLDLLDRVTAAPAERSQQALRDDLVRVICELVDDMAFEKTPHDGRKAYAAGMADAARIVAEPDGSRPLDTARVTLGGGTLVIAVVIGKRKSGWLLSAPGIGRFYHNEEQYSVHPGDLARLEGAKNLPNV